MFAPMLTTRTIRKPGRLALALSGLMLLAPAPAWAQAAKDVNCPNGCVDSSDIRDGAVRSVDILDGTVTSDDITNGTVTSADLAANVLTGANIGDGSVTGADIADGTVSLNDLAFDPGAPGDSGVMLIPAAAFHPVLDGTPFSFSIAGGYIAPGAPGDILPTETCVAAPVHLRNGVTILAFQGIFYDNTQVALVDLSLFDVSLYGWRPSTGAVSPGCDETFHDDPWEPPCESPSPLPALAPTPTTLAHVTTSLEGMGDWLALDTAVLSATVDSVNNAYYVGECFASDGVNVGNTRLYGARIYYQ